MSDRPQIAAPPVDTHALSVTYTNHFRASGSAEELILDFGLDPHRRREDIPEAPAMLQRVVLTWNNARRLAVMLHDLIQLHDKAHAPCHPDNTNRSSNPPPSTSI